MPNNGPLVRRPTGAPAPAEGAEGAERAEGAQAAGASSAAPAREAHGADVAAELVRNKEADVVFDGVHDIERWDVRLRHGGVEVAHFRFDRARLSGEGPEEEAASQPPPIGERLVMLAFERGNAAARPVSLGYEPADGDRVSVALHIPDLDEALAAMDARGFVREEAEPSQPD